MYSITFLTRRLWYVPFALCRSASPVNSQVFYVSFSQTLLSLCEINSAHTHVSMSLVMCACVLILISVFAVNLSSIRLGTRSWCRYCRVGAWTRT